ncbi:MAG TPA: hypothetical protein VJ572_06880, partial [Azonexus sp.]|nr:hypothetical protein [Azonexus sp.]
LQLEFLFLSLALRWSSGAAKEMPKTYSGVSCKTSQTTLMHMKYFPPPMRSIIYAKHDIQIELPADQPSTRFYRFKTNQYADHQVT